MPPPQALKPLSADSPRYLFSAARALLEKGVDERAFPGAVFSVLSKQEILAIEAVGQFTFDPSSTAVNPSTVYDLASVTKVLATTSMAMLLHQRGAFSLHDSVVQWLPAFAQDEPSSGPRHQVTVAMLLSHSSGLPAYARLFETYRSPPALFEACLRMPLEAPPGTRSLYSDLGFILLGSVLEKIAGEPLDGFCAREVFAPLGMTSTRFLPPSDWKTFIPPTEDDRSFRHRIIQGEVQDENCFVLGGVSGHTGLFSNAVDPLLYARSLFGGATAQAQLFSEETVRLFTARYEPPPGSSRALGWDTPSIPSSSGRLYSGHSAGHLGYAGTSLWIDLEAELAVVLLTNRTWPHRENDRIRQVRPAFHDAVLTAIAASR